MLIEFSVENHRAIRERQTFSMVAADKDTIDRLEPPHHVVETGLASVPRILVDACLFGANGAGKTSLVNAMAFMATFVRHSSDGGPDKKIGVDPFIFHSDWKTKPSEFEITFVCNGSIYRYGFVLTSEKIIEETLFIGIDKTDEWSSIFERKFNSKQNDYKWTLDGVDNIDERDSWKAKTRPNSLYLSTSVQFNAGGDLRNSYDWIANYLGILNLNMTLKGSGFVYTSSRFQEDGWGKRIQDFFYEVGIPLSNIEVDERDILEELVNKKVLSEEERIVLKNKFPEGGDYSIDFLRRDNNGKLTRLNIDNESNGIRELFNLAGPILNTLEEGKTMVVDELNLGLHPLAVQNLIAMFCDPEINKKRAQIIFTTHDPTIVEHTFLERDQVWIVKKEDSDNKKDEYGEASDDNIRDGNLAARFSRLPKFAESGTHNFVRDYLAGSYGGVPNIRRQL